MDMVKSLEMGMAKSLQVDKGKKVKEKHSLKLDEEKSLETLWREVQELDSSPNRPSSLSSQVGPLGISFKSMYFNAYQF